MRSQLVLGLPKYPETNYRLVVCKNGRTIMPFACSEKLAQVGKQHEDSYCDMKDTYYSLTSRHSY